MVIAQEYKLFFSSQQVSAIKLYQRAQLFCAPQHQPCMLLSHFAGQVFCTPLCCWPTLGTAIESAKAGCPAVLLTAACCLACRLTDCGPLACTQGSKTGHQRHRHPRPPGPTGPNV